MLPNATRSWLATNTGVFANPGWAYEVLESGLAQFPTLAARLNRQEADDGHRQMPMSLQGTLPVVFGGSTFNIPVEFWLPRMFPEHSPVAYVRPTSTMVVTIGKHVDGSGRVYHPYLANWSQSSTLGGLFQSLIAVFSVEPPVYSRPPGYTGVAIRPPGAMSPRMPTGVPSVPATAYPSARPTSSMQPLPQMTAASSLSTPDVRQYPSPSRPPGPARPAPSAELPAPPAAAAAAVSASGSPGAAAPSANGAALVAPIEQGLGRMSVEAPASPGSEKEAKRTEYRLGDVPARPPAPPLGASPASPSLPTSADDHAAESDSSDSIRQPPATGNAARNSSSSTATSTAGPGRPAEKQGAAAQAEEEAPAVAEDKAELRPPPKLQPTDSGTTVATVSGVSAMAAAVASAAVVAATATATATAAAAQGAAVAATPTTAVDDGPAASAAAAAAAAVKLTARPASSARPQAAASSLLDDEPLDDPQKRLLGYQLAIYERVTEAVNRSREKHTRVNKELLDQSANLNSGAGVIAEERHQLLESQRQLSANISVLEHKLNELNGKKAEFPDAAEITDVCKVFCGQTAAMDQLFDLAGEISAVDDTLYALGRALNDGRMPLALYMRQVRKLAQQQFMAKALAIKIRGLCGLS
ncbi:suppressor protein stp22 of temperature-sensitive alpha-factor receptor and arginine permease [Coemansia javaensis]|uniref:Suppressor protein stp22 of temperature-sensitive alpha-factor receptor and arginine permease n=1 Tax=Coemansia javaensis TaxID=2761396 RepID=A0A9W8LKG7_9FUNG|nr:suppressor protein stp22 of temperature-sensitive alpha-factor receptor and arginine permease [Coemansia javaensis]